MVCARILDWVREWGAGGRARPGQAQEGGAGLGEPSRTSTRYLLSTGRMPTGTGMMGPRSTSTGPLMGGRSAFPAGPIWGMRTTVSQSGEPGEQAPPPQEVFAM